MILAIDPGANTGWAVGDTELRACGLCRPDKGERPPIGPYDLAVAERPVLTRSGYDYAQADIVTRGNSLITLATRLGRLLESVHGRRELIVTAHDWKGSVPKDVHQAREYAKLTEAERKVLGKFSSQKDVLDAVFLLKWAIAHGGMK